MCVTDRHDMTLAVKVALNLNTTNQPTLLLADVLPFSEKSHSGESILLQDVECGLDNVPFHHVFFTSDLVSWPVILGVRSFLPIDGVHFLLGNDLARGKVDPSPVVTDKPKIEELIDPILKEISDL